MLLAAPDRGRWLLALASFLVSGVLIGAALVLADPAAVIGTLASVPLATIFIAALALIVSAIIAGFRFKMIASDLGHRLALREAMHAMAVGQVVGGLTVQFFGQIAARTFILRRQGVALPANIALASYERLVAFAVSLILATLGAVMLFGEVGLSLEQGGAQFLLLAAGCCCVVAGAATLGWGRLLMTAVRESFDAALVLRLAKTAALTVVIQSGTAAAYVSVAAALAPQIDPALLIAASLVVMFAASLPISLAGWGVRELSAVVALSAAGMPAASAVAVALVVGIGSLVTVALIALVTSALPNAAAPAPSVREHPAGFDIMAVLSLVVPLLVATFIVVQIYAPTATGYVNVNPADPIALIGGILLLFAATRSRIAWRVPHIPVAVAAMTAVIALSLAIGYARFGFTNWAFINRGFGWIILLGYAATGALIARRFGARLMVQAFVGAVLGVVAFDLAALTLQQTGWLPVSLVGPVLPLDGLSQNRNAFSFLLVVALAMTPLLGARTGWLSLLFTALWFAGSLAGFIAAAAVLAVALALGEIAIRQLAIAALAALAAVLVIGALPSLLAAISMSGGDAAMRHLQLPTSSDSSTTERLKSMLGGLALFLDYPVFGAGLGTYYDAQVRAGTPLTIHSTPVWILAEMGLVGALVFGYTGFQIVRSAWSASNADARALLLLAVAFVIMSGPHDMMYQRATWLMLGALLVVHARTPDTALPTDSRSNVLVAT